MDHMGPWSYTGFRYAIATLGMLPLLLIPARTMHDPAGPRGSKWKPLIIGGGMAGLMIAIGGDLQQAGIERTSAGKAGFITGLYVILVPLLGLLVGYIVRLVTWIGACIALIGLYLLSVQGNEQINTGDVLVFLGTFAWAAQVLIIGWASPRSDPIRWPSCRPRSPRCLRSSPLRSSRASHGSRAGQLDGLCSTAAYLPPRSPSRCRSSANANRLRRRAILLSLEAVFAAAAGWLLLHEQLDAKQLTGCGLMLAGILLSQVRTEANQIHGGPELMGPTDRLDIDEWSRSVLMEHDVDPVRGFLHGDDPLDTLPTAFHPWERLADRLPDLIGTPDVLQAVQALRLRTSSCLSMSRCCAARCCCSRSSATRASGVALNRS